MTMSRPFRVLVPLMLVVAAAMLNVVRTEAPSRRLPFDIRGLEALREMPIAHEAMVDRARELLQQQGVDPGERVAHVWPLVQRLLIQGLQKEHSSQEILEFASRGARLVDWTVTFQETSRILDGEPALKVRFDQSGRVCGVEIQGLADTTPPADMEVWTAELNANAAFWSGLDPALLTPGHAARPPLSGGSGRSAFWELDGVRLGDASVHVVMQYGGGKLKVDRWAKVPEARRFRGGTRGSRGASYWAVIVLCAVAAFAMGGGARGDVVRPTASRTLVIALPAGLVLLTIVFAFQAVSMSYDELYARVFGGLALAGIGLFVSMAWTILRRGIPQTQLIPLGYRILFPLAAVLAFVASSFGCLGGEFDGCNRTCALIRFCVAPIAVLTLIAGQRDRRFLAFGVPWFTLALTPHCICANVGNLPWIELLGGSPMCYFWGCAAGMFGICGLVGVRTRLCAALVILGTLAMGAGSVGHTLFRFPW